MRSTGCGVCVSKSDSFDSLAHSLTWERAKERGQESDDDTGREKESRGPVGAGTRRCAHHPGRGMADRHDAGFCGDRRPRHHLHHGRDGIATEESGTTHPSRWSHANGAKLHDGLDAVDVLVKFQLEGLAARGPEIVAVQPRANPPRLLVSTLPCERSDLHMLGRGYGEGESAVATEHLQRYRVPLVSGPC